MKPLPPQDAANRPYWEGARRGVLMLQRCTDCGQHRFPAARYCARCRGERSAWVETSGRGVIESYCSFHKAYWPAFEAELPYEVLQVRLDEGVCLFSNLVRGAARAGLKVKAHFEPITPSVTLVKFVPL